MMEMLIQLMMYMLTVKEHVKELLWVEIVQPLLQVFGEMVVGPMELHNIHL